MKFSSLSETLVSISEKNMVNAGVDHVHRDVILGHSLHGMDIHYMAPSEEDLHRAMARYTEWLDDQLNLQSVDHFVDQTKKSDTE